MHVCTVILYNAELTMDPLSVVIDYGTPAELSCSATSSGQLTFIWYLTNYGITRVQTFLSSRENSNVTDVLVVDNVTNNLTLMCTISSQGHSITSQEVYIGVPDEASRF